MLTVIRENEMSLEDKYQFMKTLIQWDHTVVSDDTCTASGSRFRIGRIMEVTGLPRYDVLQMIASLKEHLEPIVDDMDFCNKFHWCHEKARKSDYSNHTRAPMGSAKPRRPRWSRGY
jgi:hypothetical protein